MILESSNDRQGRSVGGVPQAPPPPKAFGRGGARPPQKKFHPHLGISYKSKAKNDSTRRKFVIFCVLGVKKCIIFKKNLPAARKNVSFEENAGFFLSRAPNIVLILKSLCISSIRSSKIGQKKEKSVIFFACGAKKYIF